MICLIARITMIKNSGSKPMSQNQGSDNVPILRFPGYNNGWENKTLESIVSNISSGKSKNINLDGKYPFYGSTGIVGFSDSYDYSEKCLLIARVGANAGFLYKVSGNYCVTDNTLMINVPKDIDEDYLYYLLIKSNLNKLIYGSGQPLITSGMLKSLFINIPSLPEQQKIASFLTTVDEKLQALKKKKTLLEQYKKGVMQKIFSQEIRFKDDNGKEFPEWEEKQLGSIGTFFSGGTPLTTNRNYFDGEIPFIRSGEINSDKTLQFISEEGLNNSSAKMVEIGDLIYALYGATSGEVAISKIKGAINQAILCIRANIVNYFLYYYLSFQKKEILQIYLQGGQGNLSAEIIKSLLIPYPSLPEQTKIANFLTAIDDKINHCQTQIEKTEMWKKGLLQRMFC